MSLGTSLRSLREGRGLSIEELSERTHVSSHIIEDFEADKFDRITAAVYGSGFVKILAKAFGVDAEPLREMFKTQYKAWVEDAAANVLPKPPPKKFDERRLSERDAPPAREAQKPGVAKPSASRPSAEKTAAKPAPKPAAPAPAPAPKPEKVAPAPAPAPKPATPAPAPAAPAPKPAAPALAPAPAPAPAPAAPAPAPAPAPVAPAPAAPKPAPSPLPDVPQAPEKPAEPERPPLVLDDSPPEPKGVIDDLFSLKPPVIKPDEQPRRDPEPPQGAKDPASASDDAPTFEEETPGKLRLAIAAGFSKFGAGCRRGFKALGSGLAAIGTGFAAIGAAMRTFAARLPLRTIGLVAAIAVAAIALIVLVRNSASVDEVGETPEVAEVVPTPEPGAEATAEPVVPAAGEAAPVEAAPVEAAAVEAAEEAEPAVAVVITGSALTDNLLPPPDCYAE